MPLKSTSLLLLASATLAWAVEFRVAAFNIEAKFNSTSGNYVPSLGAPGTADFESVRAILARIDADVVSLEEVHASDDSGNRVNQLAASLGYPHVFISPSTNTFDTTLRVAFLSRFPFLSTTSIGSPAGSKDMTRRIPAVKVDVPGTMRDPLLIAAHLKSGSDDSEQFQRTVEMRRLTNHLGSSGTSTADNFIVMGDFNLSDSNTTFTALPPTGLPASFNLGPDITLPISYYINPTSYFSNPTVVRIVPRQLDESIITHPTPSGGSDIDLFLVSPIIGSRPSHSEIYNSALDTSNTTGLSKAGNPPDAGTSATASDHFAIFGDFELDPALPYAFVSPGQTVTEDFTGFLGTYNPYPWVITGGTWKGAEAGTSTGRGFRAYGTPGDPSLGILPAPGGGSATAFFVNHSAQVLGTLRISYTGEQWRAANVGTADTLSADLIVNGIPQPLPGLTFHPATNLTSGPIAGGLSTPGSVMVGGLSIPPGAEFQLKFTDTPGAGGGLLPAEVFINEFDYDDKDADTGEFVEIVVGPGYTGQPKDISLLLYRGAGTVYGTHSLSTFAVGQLTPSGHRIYSKAISGIQNTTSGLALVVNGTLTQFISYEGTVTATENVASGMTSTDIGVYQTGMEREGESSLGLVGTGGNYQNMSWKRLDDLPYSAGNPNPGQLLTTPPQPQGISIDNLAVTFVDDNDGDGFTDAEEAIFGTDPFNAASFFAAVFTRPSPATVSFGFPTVTGRTYVIESSGNLSDWSGVTSYEGNGSVRVENLPVDPMKPANFYRVRVTLN